MEIFAKTLKGKTAWLMKLVLAMAAASGLADPCIEADAQCMLSVRAMKKAVEEPPSNGPGAQCPYQGWTDGEKRCPTPELLSEVIKASGPGSMSMYDAGCSAPAFARCDMPGGSCGGDSQIPCCTYCVHEKEGWKEDEPTPFLPNQNLGTPIPAGVNATGPNSKDAVTAESVVLTQSVENGTNAFIQAALISRTVMKCPYERDEHMKGGLVCPTSDDFHKMVEAKKLNASTIQKVYGVASCDKTASCPISNCGDDFPCCVHCLWMQDNQSASGVPVPRSDTGTGTSEFFLNKNVEVSDDGKKTLKYLGYGAAGVGGAAGSFGLYKIWKWYRAPSAEQMMEKNFRAQYDMKAKYEKPIDPRGKYITYSNGELYLPADYLEPSDNPSEKAASESEADATFYQMNMKDVESMDDDFARALEDAISVKTGGIEPPAADKSMVYDGGEVNSNAGKTIIDEAIEDVEDAAEEVEGEVEKIAEDTVIGEAEKGLEEEGIPE